MARRILVGLLSLVSVLACHERNPLIEIDQVDAPEIDRVSIFKGTITIFSTTIDAYNPIIERHFRGLLPNLQLEDIISRLGPPDTVQQNPQGASYSFQTTSGRIKYDVETRSSTLGSYRTTVLSASVSPGDPDRVFTGALGKAVRIGMTRCELSPHELILMVNGFQKPILHVELSESEEVRRIIWISDPRIDTRAVESATHIGAMHDDVTTPNSQQDRETKEPQ